MGLPAKFCMKIEPPAVSAKAVRQVRAVGALAINVLLFHATRFAGDFAKFMFGMCFLRAAPSRICAGWKSGLVGPLPQFDAGPVDGDFGTLTIVRNCDHR